MAFRRLIVLASLVPGLALQAGQRTVVRSRRPIVERRDVKMAAVATQLRRAKDVVGNIFVPPPPPLSRTRVEGSELYQMLGVAPDAEFEEIQEAVKELKMKYADDKKMQIKIEVTKEKISDLRLQQRLAGVLRVSAGVAKKEASLEQFEKKQKVVKLKSKVPKIFQEIPDMWNPFWIPETDKEKKRWNKNYFKASRNYFAVSALVISLFPGMITAVNAGCVLIFGAHLQSRGRPPVKRAPSGEIAEMREERWGRMVWSFALVGIHGLVGRFIGDLIAPYFVILRPKQCRALFAVASMAFASVVWETYSTKKGMKRKSSYIRGGNQD